MLLVLAVPVALVIAIVLFFYGAYGDRVPFGNVPVPSAPSVPSAPTGPAPAG